MLRATSFHDGLMCYTAVGKAAKKNMPVLVIRLGGWGYTVYMPMPSSYANVEKRITITSSLKLRTWHPITSRLLFELPGESPDFVEFDRVVRGMLNRISTEYLGRNGFKYFQPRWFCMHSSNVCHMVFTAWLRGNTWEGIYLNVFDLSCRLIIEIEGIMFVFSLVGALSFFDGYGKIWVACAMRRDWRLSGERARFASLSLRVSVLGKCHSQS